MAGDWAGTVDAARAYLVEAPRGASAAEVSLLAARAARRTGDEAAACRFAEDAAGLGASAAGDPEAALLLAECAERGGDPSRAAAGYVDVLLARPEEPVRRRASERLGVLLADLPTPAVRSLAASSTSKGRPPELWAELASRALAENRPEEARALLEELLAASPPDAWRDRAQALLGETRLVSRSVALAPGGGPPRVGVLLPLSGRYGDLGRSVLDGVTLAFREWNARAGEGTPAVEAIVRDTEGDPIHTVEAALALVRTENVSAFVGPLLYGPTLGAAAVAAALGVPLLTPSALAEEIAAVGEAVVPTSAPSVALAEEVAEFAVSELLLGRIAVFYADDPPSRASAEAFIHRALADGAEVVAIETYSPEDTDFGGQLRRIALAEPEGLFLPARPEEMLLIAPQIRFYDIQAQILGTGRWDGERVLTEGKQFLEGAVFSMDRLDYAGSRYRAEFAARYRIANGAEPPAGAARGYETARVLLEGLRRGRWSAAMAGEEPSGSEAGGASGSPPAANASAASSPTAGGASTATASSAATPAAAPAVFDLTLLPLLPWTPHPRVSLLAVRSGQLADLKGEWSDLPRP